MLQLFRLFWKAIKAWWRELVLLLVLNFIWLVAQLTIVLGPPTTAMLYGIAEKVLDGELVGFEDAWKIGRDNFVRSWIWGVPQLVIYLLLVLNLMAYADTEGAFVLGLRYAWTLLLLVWFAINLYYWPFYFAQEDRSFRTTISNAAKMALLNPGFTFLYALLVIVLILLSVVTGLLLGAVLGMWVALWGTLIVRDRLKKLD